MIAIKKKLFLIDYLMRLNEIKSQIIKFFKQVIFTTN